MNIYTDVIRDYMEHGFAVIPIPFQSKTPIIPGWQNLILTEEDIDTYFEEPTNIGVLMGRHSNGLVDVDLDDLDTLRFAPGFLPETKCIFCRASKPRSHWVYRVPDAGKRKPFSVNETMILELRGSGCCTVFPGSRHESGEIIEFDDAGDFSPGTATWVELNKAATKIAIATLLYKHWSETSHERHDLALAVSAFLVRQGWDQGNVSRLVEAVAKEAGDNQLEDRLRAVDDTFEDYAHGKPVSGDEQLALLLGKEVAEKIIQWTCIKSPKQRPLASSNAVLNKDITSDAGSADAFSNAFKGQLLYSSGQWFQKNNQIFEPVAIEVVQGVAKTFLQQEVKTLIDGQVGFPSLKACLGRARINASIELSRASFQTDPAVIDSDIYLVGCTDGSVIELASGECLQREAIVTKRLGAAVNPEATCPRWATFLQQVFRGDTDIISFVQRAVGYSLSGSVKEQCFFILVGDGANGKSTLIKALQHLFGDYAGSIPMNTLMEQRFGNEQTNDLASLFGKRFVAASEGERGQKLAESKIKKITGGDRIVCRFMYKDYFEFDPQFKLWLATNELPAITGMDDAIWRRVMVIHFPVKFAPEQQDKTLVDRLKDELPGILNWAITGYQSWKHHGLNAPPQVQGYTKDYRKQNDSVSQWIESTCIVADSAKATMNVLYSSYNVWCRDSGLEAISIALLGKELERRGFPIYRASTGNGRKGIMPKLPQQENTELFFEAFKTQTRERFEQASTKTRQ